MTDATSKTTVADSIACQLLAGGHDCDRSDGADDVPCGKPQYANRFHGRGRICKRCGYWECMGCVSEEARAAKRKGLVYYKEFDIPVISL